MTKWEKEFELEVNRFQIKYNKPAQGGSAKDISYDQQLVIDRRSTIDQLKAEVAKRLRISVDALIFRRGGAHGEELIEDDLTFKQANIYNMMSVFVEEGEPTRYGWKRLKFSAATLYTPDWSVFAPENTGEL